MKSELYNEIHYLRPVRNWWNKHKELTLAIIFSILMAATIFIVLSYWNRAEAMNGLAIHECISDVRAINQVDVASTLKVGDCVNNPYQIK